MFAPKISKALTKAPDVRTRKRAVGASAQVARPLRAGAAEHLQATIGNRAMLRCLGQRPSLPVVGPATGPLEHEADRVADQVVRMPAPEAVTGAASAPVSRKSSEVAAAAAGVGEAPANVHQVLRSPGSPLDSETRSFFEPRLGHDLGRVRIHDGAIAHEASTALLARAFTVGTHVVFGVGRYQPASGEGRRLLAHELVHVVQQTGVGPAGAPSGRASHAPVVQRAPVGVQREPLSEAEIAKLSADQVAARLAANEREAAPKVLDVGTADRLTAERDQLIKRQQELSNAPGINAPAESAEARWRSYKDMLDHTWDVEAKYPGYSNELNRMNAVGRWSDYVTPEELRHFLDLEPDMKDLYYRWRTFEEKAAPGYYREMNDPWVHTETGTPSDPLVEGYVAGQVTTARRSEFRRAREIAAARATFEKMQGVGESGAFATLGRVAGAITGWVSGRDVLESSEVGAAVFGTLDTALTYRAAQVSRERVASYADPEGEPPAATPPQLQVHQGGGQGAGQPTGDLWSVPPEGAPPRSAPQVAPKPAEDALETVQSLPLKMAAGDPRSESAGRASAVRSGGGAKRSGPPPAKGTVRPAAGASGATGSPVGRQSGFTDAEIRAEHARATRGGGAGDVWDPDVAAAFGIHISDDPLVTGPDLRVAGEGPREAGNAMNRIARFLYPHNEVPIRTRADGLVWLDSYNPVTKEIISRKFMQLAEVGYETGLDALQEARVKYPSGARVARTPAAGPLAGQTVTGQLILEVPIQRAPVPPELLEYARSRNIQIRDLAGTVY